MRDQEKLHTSQTETEDNLVAKHSFAEFLMSARESQHPDKSEQLADIACGRRLIHCRTFFALVANLRVL